MSNFNNRIIRENDTTLTDITVEMNDVFNQVHGMDIVAAEDALYFGSDLPFNHKFIMVDTANDQASSISIDLWDGNGFDNSAIDILDRTSLSGNTLSQSGIISFNREKEDAWVIESTTEDIPDLSSFRIFDKYWMKMTFSGDLNALTQIKYIGQKFSDDDDLQALYPSLVLSSVKTAFESGKTNWDEQHVVAAEQMITRFRMLNKIWTPDSILDWNIFTEASTHLVASIIYRAFGDDYKDQFDQAVKDFNASFKKINFGIDRDEDGRLEEFEKIQRVQLFRR